MTTSIATNQTILVVGGGIGGMTAALEVKQAGLDGHVIQPERLQKIAERKK